MDVRFRTYFSRNTSARSNRKRSVFEGRHARKLTNTRFDVLVRGTKLVRVARVRSKRATICTHATSRPGFGREEEKVKKAKKKKVQDKEEGKSFNLRSVESTDEDFEARLERLRKSNPATRATKKNVVLVEEKDIKESGAEEKGSSKAIPILALLLAGAFAWTFAFGDGAPPPTSTKTWEVDTSSEGEKADATPFSNLRKASEALVADGKRDEALSMIEEASRSEQMYDSLSLLLLKASVYSGWEGHAPDAAALYDRAIKEYPEDFRSYLGRGAFLQSRGKRGDAERMFLKARFLAPSDAKGLVDRITARYHDVGKVDT